MLLPLSDFTGDAGVRSDCVLGLSEVRASSRHELAAVGRAITQRLRRQSDKGEDCSAGFLNAKVIAAHLNLWL